MKPLLTVVLLLISMTAPAIAANPEQRSFADFASKQGYEYTYISPQMLQILGSQYIDNKSFGNLDLQAKHLTSVESLTTSVNSQDDGIWDKIRKVKEENKLKTLSTKQNATRRYDILANISGDGKFITRLMIVTQKGATAMSVVYLTGRIPVSALRYATDTL